MTGAERKTVNDVVRLFHARMRMAGITLIARGETLAICDRGGFTGDTTEFHFGMTKQAAALGGREALYRYLREAGFETTGNPSFMGVSFEILTVPGQVSKADVWLCGVFFAREAEWNRLR